MEICLNMEFACTGFSILLILAYFIFFYENYPKLASFNLIPRVKFIESRRWNDDVFGLKGRNFIKSHMPLSILPSKRSFMPVESRRGKQVFKGSLDRSGLFLKRRIPKSRRDIFSEVSF